VKHQQFARRLIAATALIAFAASCSGGGSHAALPSVPAAGSGGTASTSSHAVSVLHASTAFTSTATLIGPATTIDSVVLHVVPALQNAAGLVSYAEQASDPTSGVYRHFLTASDIGSRFGATAADYAAVANYFASYGLKVGGWPQRLALTVAGPRPSMERAIGTTFGFYRSREGHTLLAPMGNVQFARPIPVASIANAVVDPKARWRNLVRGSGGPSQQSLSGSTPQQIAAAFDYDSAYNAGFTGAGITIGIIGTGPAMTADVAAYRAQYAWPGSGTLVFPPVNANSAANSGGSPTATPPPVTAPCSSSSNPNLPPTDSPTPTCNPEDFEAQIDTEQATLARDATIEFYLAYVPVECNTPGAASCSPDPNTGLGYAYQGIDEADDEVQQIIADDTADVVSGSYGGPEVLQNVGYVSNVLGGYDPSALVPSEMAALAAEGIAAFFSSGDQGAQSCAPYSLGFVADLQCVGEPASDDNVTAVGGVTTPLSNAGTFTGPITGWGQQTFYNGQGGASGGGVSCIYPAPPWQTQPTYEGGSLLTIAGSSACAYGASPGGRVLPDASLEADPATAVGVVANSAFGGETQFLYGGTSVAAPEMAAMWALVLQACSQSAHCDTASGAKPYRLGNAAPLLWRIYQTQAQYDSTIDDVTFGNNGVAPCYFQQDCPNPVPSPDPGYSAGAGWDPVTGLGVPFARHLIAAVTGS
jgi:subtilase family serine protease